MDDYEFLRETFRRGYKAEPGHYPATYRSPLGRMRGADDGCEPYDHYLYIAICKTLDTMPLILRRYFVITTVERVARKCFVDAVAKFRGQSAADEVESFVRANFKILRG